MKKTLWLALILLLVCIFALSACDSEDTPSNTNNVNNQQTTTDNSGSEEEGNNSSNTTVVCQHTFGNWQTVKQATCKEEGKLVRTCSKCSETEESTVSKTDIHTEVVDAAVSATCTIDGKTEGKHCSVCGTITVAQTSVKALGHTEVIDSAVQATCTVDGKTEGKHCSVCSETLVKQITVKSKGHTEVIDVAIPATCTTTGLTEGKHCSVCKATIKNQETTKKIKHAYTDTECTMCHIISPSFVKNNSTSKDTLQDGYGNKVTYYYYDSVLVLSGSGDMPNYSVYSSYDWAYSALKRVIIEEGITSVSDWAFYDQQSLIEVELPKTLKTIGSSSFYCCKKLPSITIPNSVTVISDSAFASCNDLAEINYNGQLESLIYNAFSSTAYISNDLNWDGDIFYFANYLVMVNTEYSGTSVVNWKGDVRIDKAGITAICPMAFSGCNLIENVILGEDIKSIGYRAFMGCTSLKSITFSSKITSMANNVFNGCSNLRYIYYSGTTQQWGEIKKWADWNKNTGYYEVVCSNGSISKWSS